MEHDRRSAALGAFALALVLTAVTVTGQAVGSSGVDTVDLTRSQPPVTVSSVVAAALGWPVRSDQPDPGVWRELDGVGPTLAVRLASAAQEGALNAPSDLLRVRGIGARMARDLAGSIEWVGATGSER